MPIDHDDLAWATAVVRRRVPPTPQYAWPLLARAVGAEVWVKHENHTPTGAFKVRGGLVLAERLVAGGSPPPGLISATTGNHGQSLAYAGRAVGLPVTIVVPEGNNPEKNAAMAGFGAELVEHGRDFQAAREHAGDLAADRDLLLVPPYHPDLVLGVATYAAELFGAVAGLDVVYVPIGQGSGISGVIGVRDLLGATTDVVGVVAERAPAQALSFAAGRPVATDTAATFAEGVACRAPDAEAVEVISRGAARVVTVGEDEIAAAMRLHLTATHNVAEPAGAIALAALIRERSQVGGRKVAVIQSGGNIDAPRLATVLAGRTPSA